MPRKSSIDTLPDDVRHWLERALTENNFSGYEALEAMLRERGYMISKSSIHRYGQKIERRFAAIKASTEAARLLTEGAADDQDARSDALIALIQTDLFESIITLQEASEEDIDPKERVTLLSKVAKNIATLSRASVNVKKHQIELREKVSAKLQELEKEAVKPGSQLDAETVRRIAQDVYGIMS